MAVSKLQGSGVAHPHTTTQKLSALKIRTTRGTSETDLRRFFLKAIVTDNCTFAEIKEAFTRDLKAKVAVAKVMLARHDLIKENPRGFEASVVIKIYYNEASNIASRFLTSYRGQWVEFESIYQHVVSNSDSIGKLPAEWKRWLVSFALAEFTASGLCRQKYDSGKNLFQLQPGEKNSTFQFFFKIRSERGTTDMDITAFFLKLLACSTGTLTYEEIERSFTYNLEQTFERIKTDLLSSGIIKEAGGKCLFTDIFYRVYRTIKESSMKHVESSAYKLALEHLEGLVKPEVLASLDGFTRNQLSEEKFHDMFLAALTRLEVKGKIRVMAKEFSGQYKVYVIRCKIPGGLPALFLLDGEQF